MPAKSTSGSGRGSDGDSKTVQGDEAPRLRPRRPIPQPVGQRALAAVDTHARPDVRHVGIDGHAAADLADVEARVAAVEVEAGRPVYVDPLRLELAVAVEDLH